MSLYDKISRNLSIFDSHSHKGEGRSRKSSRQRSVSDVTKPKLEELIGVENKSYQKEEEMDGFDDNIELIINRKHLETITENQNSPYSTQASQLTARRMSAQSIFSDPATRGTLPPTAPLLQLFHQNELAEKFADERKKEKSQTSVETSQSYAKCSVLRQNNSKPLLESDNVDPSKSKISQESQNEYFNSMKANAVLVEDLDGPQGPPLQRR